MQSGEEGLPLEMLGMAEESMFAYAESLIQQQAAEHAAAEGITLEEELDSPAYAAVRASMAYVVKVIVANNAYLTRHLLSLGVIPQGAGLELKDDNR